MTTATDGTGGDGLEGPGKGQVFFERAHTVADTGNYEFAIQMYMEGFNREPGNADEFRNLYKMALIRKSKGGKPAGGIMGPKPPFKGKGAKDQYLNATWSLAHDPGDRQSMMNIVRLAVELGHRDVIYYISGILLTANSTNPHPKRSYLLELVDAFEAIKDFHRAVEVAMLAAEMPPKDMELDSRIKNLSASALMQKSYEQNSRFTENIKDKDETRQLLMADNLQKSLEFRQRAVATAKAAYDANPIVDVNITKYGRALAEMDDEDHENQAIEVYNKAYRETKVYRYKMAIGDIKIKQLNRNIRMLKDAVEQDPTDQDLKHSLEEQVKTLREFEIVEYAQRAEAFPTDLQVQYEYAARLYDSQRYDDAIPILQLVQNNPRYRADSLHKLGRCFYETGFKVEAVETLRRAIESYDNAEIGDNLSKEYHYWLGRALEETNVLPEASKIYSKIMQWDFSYRDVRVRLKKLRDAAA